MKLKSSGVSRTAYIILMFIGVLTISLFTKVEPSLASLGIDSVQPNLVSNQIATTIIITGTDFVDGATVILEGYGSLQANVLNDTTLHALLPAGIPSGVYALRILNPDGNASVLNNALTVLQQTQVPENTPTIPPSVPGYERPVVVVNSYSVNTEKLSPGQDFELAILLYNAGQRTATNVVATFSVDDLIPRVSGGVKAVGNIAPDNRSDFVQSFTVSGTAWGKSFVSTNMTLLYTDPEGFQYSEIFTLTISLYNPGYAPPTPTPTITPTPTEGPPLRPQLVITEYELSDDPIQPGMHFTLNLSVVNQGEADAKRVTMIVGGGSQMPSGTQDNGGISGSSGEFTNFAPVGSSNVQFIGDINLGSSIHASQDLIVNVSTNPGAYPLKISFVYNDPRNNRLIDDQVITLLVYSLPVLDISFYRDPNPLFAGQPNQLPIQIVNLGRKSIVLGNLRVDVQEAELSNDVIFVGALEPGGYFPMDAMLIPFQSGTSEIFVSIDYTDDFNQSQVISQTLMVEILEAQIFEPEGPGIGPGEGEAPPPAQEDSFWQKVKRFFLGLLGLDSGIQAEGPAEGMPPMEEQPVEAVPIGPIKGP
jgi:hypothetical protein